MNLAESFIGAIDASRATDVDLKILNTRRDRKAKISLQATKTPLSVRNRIFDERVSRVNPFGEKLDPYPFNFGSEAIVYGSTDGISVVKVYHKQGVAKEQVNQFTAFQKIVEEYIGKYVARSSFVVGESPYGPGECMYALQERIHGDDSEVDHELLEMLFEANRRFLADTGCIIDMYENNIVSMAGEPMLIDVGRTMCPTPQ